MNNKNIFIISSGIGMAGGADRVTKLLADEYINLGYHVFVFATSCEIQSNHKYLKICSPLINVGHRYRFPQISLILRLFFASFFTKSLFVHCVGLTLEVRLVLKFLSQLKIIVWETTEAKPRNKFVDPQIIPLLERTYLMLAPSEIIRQNIINTYQYQGTINILPFWIQWKPLGQQKNHKRSNKMLYIGRLDIDKGFDCLFTALRLIKDEVTIQLDICGRGNQKIIKEMSSDLDNVHVHGWIDEIKADTLTMEADYMILPSKHEGYPLSLIESCSKGKPIIASAVGSIPEIFANKKCAFLFETENSLQLAEIIKKAFTENDRIYSERCADARQVFEMINNPQKIDKDLTQIIQQLT